MNTEDPFRTLTLSGSTGPNAAFNAKGDPLFSQIPERIGSYKIEYILDESKDKVLYLGTDEKNTHPVVIKVLFVNCASKQDVIEQFLQEARIISLADHPHIVRLYDQGNWDNGLYIAMEFIEGVSLRQYILKRPIPLKKALELIIDIAYALCHLHTHGIIHRDVKPDNILITEKEKIKVIDFGISRLMEEQNTKERKIAGTPFYMSPEQRDNQQSIGYPSDIYSLGIVAYELILGRLCHGKIHLSLLPKGLRAIFSKAMQIDPKDRYQDIVDFISDLTTYMATEAFQEDILTHDSVAELAEAVENATKDLTSKQTIQTSFQDIAISHYTGLRTPSFFYDLQSEEECISAHVLWPPSYSPKETLECLSAMGAIKGLQNLKYQGQELWKKLQEIFFDVPFTPKSFFWLHLDPQKERGEVFCQGTALLFLCPSATKKWEQLFFQTPQWEKRPFSFEWKKGDSLAFLLSHEKEELPASLALSSLPHACALTKEKPCLKTTQLLSTHLKHQKKTLLQENFLVGVAKQK